MCLFLIIQNVFWGTFFLPGIQWADRNWGERWGWWHWKGCRWDPNLTLWRKAARLPAYRRCLGWLTYRPGCEKKWHLALLPDGTSVMTNPQTAIWITHKGPFSTLSLWLIPPLKMYVANSRSRSSELISLWCYSRWRFNQSVDQRSSQSHIIISCEKEIMTLILIIMPIITMKTLHQNVSGLRHRPTSD